MGKHPEISTEILKECNNKYGEALGLKQICLILCQPAIVAADAHFGIFPG